MPANIKAADAANVGGGLGRWAGGSSGGQLTTGGGARQALTNGSGKVCAVISGATLRKTVSRRSGHQLRTPPAWALDAAHLDIAEQAGCETVRLVDRDDGSTWTAPLATFRTHGFTFNRGYGQQIALALNYWRHVVPGAPVQLGLWA